jgi:hypothetical protein
VELEPKQQVAVSISARRRWNDTGVRLVAGQGYRFEARDEWTDFFIKRNADGFRSEEAPFFSRGLLKKHEERRRQPAENWFCLIGAIDREPRTAFRIGTGTEYVAAHTGVLTPFANDEWSYYWNNWGSLTLSVTRLG